jgi:hypothetical protein
LSQNNVKYKGLTLTFRTGDSMRGLFIRCWYHNAGVYRDADIYMLAGEK